MFECKRLYQQHPVVAASTLSRNDRTLKCNFIVIIIIIIFIIIIIIIIIIIRIVN
jgi:hypothetical protein